MGPGLGPPNFFLQAIDLLYVTVMTKPQCFYFSNVLTPRQDTGVARLSAKTSLAHMAGISLETRLGVFFRTLEFRRFQIGK